MFKITDEGVFELLTFDKVYKNYLVFIDVFNTAIWSKTQDYLVDVSFRDIDPAFVISEPSALPSSSKETGNEETDGDNNESSQASAGGTSS